MKRFYTALVFWGEDIYHRSTRSEAITQLCLLYWARRAYTYDLTMKERISVSATFCIYIMAGLTKIFTQEKIVPKSVISLFVQGVYSFNSIENLFYTDRPSTVSRELDESWSCWMLQVASMPGNCDSLNFYFMCVY